MLNGNEQMDTFDDMTPIEATQDSAPASKPENPEEDTFDNGYYEGEHGSEEQVEGEEGDKKKAEFEKIKKNDQTKQLDEEEEGEKKEGKKPEEKKSDDEGDKKPESEGDSDKEDKTPKGKIVRLKDGDKTVDLSPDATVKVKVKGKNEIVTIEELKADYSGKKAWTEEIEVAKSKQQDAETKLQKFQQEKQGLVTHLEKIAGLLDKEEGDPLEALYYLLDMTGRDVNTYNKRVFDFMEEQVQTMSEMDDVEKDLYWTKKSLESLRSNQAAKAESAKQEQATMELIAKVDKLRESQGVSEEQYVQAHSELIENGHKEDDLTPEMVINYQVMKPHVEKALDLAEQFEDDLGDDDMDALVHETALTLKAYPHVSDQDALIMSAKKLGYDVETIDDDIKELNDKIGNERDVETDSNLKYKGSKDESHVESFDDFDY